MLQRLLILVLLLFACGLSGSAKGEITTPAMRAADARLSTPITLDESSIPLAELLAKLSAQSGVNLSADLRENASGRKLFIVCDKTPLKDVMDALWSLLSYQTALWKWGRTGKAGAYRYDFTPTPAAADVPRTLQALTQKAYDDHIISMLAVSAMTPQERQQNLSKIGIAMLQKDSNVTRQIADDEFVWSGLRTFTHALTSQQQQSVLHGDRVAITLDQLPEEARASLNQAWTALNPMRVLPNGQAEPIAVPKQFAFVGNSGPPFMKSITPTLFFEVSDFGAMSILGNILFKNGVCDKIRDFWMLPGDKEDNPLARRLCALPAKPETPSLRPTTEQAFQEAVRQGRDLSAANITSPLQTRFGQLARSLPVAIIAQLPDPAHQAFDPGAPYNQPAQVFLKRMLSGKPKLMTKWRGDVLLVSYPTWFLYEGERAPYALVQQMQRAGKHSFVPLPVLAEIADQITEDQWQDLCRNAPLQYMQAAYPMLVLCRHNPELLRSDGLNLSPETLNALYAVPALGQYKMLFDGSVRALRVQPVTRKFAAIEVYEMQVQYQHSDRQWKPLLGYSQRQTTSP